MEAESLYRIVEVSFFLFNSIVLAYYLPIIVSIFVLLPLALKVYTRLSCGLCRSYRRLDGRTAVVTGGNIGIGLETAKDLARRGAKVILACRSLEKGKAALDEIRRETGSSDQILKHLDLCSFASVRKFCGEINAEETRLDILINNAGGSAIEKALTEDKLELIIQANHYGPFHLTILLLDLLQKTEKARIVNVASLAHWMVRDFDLENLSSETTWDPVQAYSRSKLANVLFTRELSRRLREKGNSDTTANALHPGIVRTAFFRNSNKVWTWRIFNYIQTFFGKNVVEGAQTTIHVAVSEELDGVSGEYYDDCQKAWTSGRSKDRDLARRLWDHSVKVVGLKAAEISV